MQMEDHSQRSIRLRTCVHQCVNGLHAYNTSPRFLAIHTQKKVITTVVEEGKEEAVLFPFSVSSYLFLLCVESNKQNTMVSVLIPPEHCLGY